MHRATRPIRGIFVSFMSAVAPGMLGTAWADTINLGFVSFDGFIPGDLNSPGVNEF
jgi:hypothetical protein